MVQHVRETVRPTGVSRRDEKVNYWKVFPQRRFSKWTVQALKQEIDSFSGGGRHYNQSTPRARLCKLAYRANRRLQCYDGDLKNSLKKFCSQRKLPVSLQAANKPVLMKALEDADEAATFDRFLDLPPELRILIYDFHCADFEFRADPTHEDVPGRELKYPSAPPITQVSSLIRRESLPCFYKAATFVFSYEYSVKSFGLAKPHVISNGIRFLDTLPAESIAMIRHLSFRGKFTHYIPGIAPESTEVDIDMGAGREEPKLMQYRRPEAPKIGLKSNLKIKLENQFNFRILRFVQNMAGRSNDKRLLMNDLRVLSGMHRRHGPLKIFFPKKGL